MAKNDDIYFSLVLMGMSPVVFWSGIKNLRLRRIIMDTPTSKIDTAAVGSFVEIQGRVYTDDMMKLQSPMSKQSCVAFILKLERLEKRGKSSKWVLKKQFFSHHFIYLNDGGDHLAAIDLGVCDFKGVDESSSQTFNREEDLDSQLKTFLAAEKLLPTFETGFFTVSQKYRLTEKIFLPNETLYAMGAAVSVPTHEQTLATVDATIAYGKTSSRRQQEISFALNKLSKDPEVVTGYDVNGDRKLDESELKELRSDLAKQILDKPTGSYYLEKSKFCLTSSEMNKKLFGIDKVVLSRHSEKSLTNRLLLKGWLKIIAAPLMMILGIFIFTNRPR